MKLSSPLRIVSEPSPVSGRSATTVVVPHRALVQAMTGLLRNALEVTDAGEPVELERKARQLVSRG